jgi:MFS superfamily sulfate permease-like transporter
MPLSRLSRAFPDWLVSYRKGWLRPDLLAGLTAAAVVIPKVMAYATIAGLPVQVGLYTALLPLIIYAFLGTSRALSVSTTTTIAILTAAELRGGGVFLLVLRSTFPLVRNFQLAISPSNGVALAPLFLTGFLYRRETKSGAWRVGFVTIAVGSLLIALVLVG